MSCAARRIESGSRAWRVTPTTTSGPTAREACGDDLKVEALGADPGVEVEQRGRQPGHGRDDERAEAPAQGQEDPSPAQADEQRHHRRNHPEDLAEYRGDEPGE